MPNSISILEKKRVDKSYWRGSQLDILLGLYYIKSRGGKERFVMFGNPMINQTYKFDQVVQNTHIYYNFKNGLLTSPINFTIKLTSLLNGYGNEPGRLRFGIIPVFLVGNQFTHAHSNVLIFDFKNKTCQRFEPYGFSTDDTKFDTKMRDLLNRKFGVKYLKPLKDEDFQEIEEHQISISAKTAKKITGDPGGYCAAWCIWYVDLKVKNPDLSREELKNKITQKLDKLETSVRTLIRNYANYLIRGRGRVLTKKGLDKKRKKFSQIEQLRLFYNK